MTESTTMRCPYPHCNLEWRIEITHDGIKSAIRGMREHEAKTKHFAGLDIGKLEHAMMLEVVDKPEAE